jgi:hypothetical protein
MLAGLATTTFCAAPSVTMRNLTNPSIASSINRLAAILYLGGNLKNTKLFHICLVLVSNRYFRQLMFFSKRWTAVFLSGRVSYLEDLEMRYNIKKAKRNRSTKNAKDCAVVSRG